MLCFRKCKLIYLIPYRHHEAVSHFEALLVDLIRQPDYTWKEAKKVLKKDARYDSFTNDNIKIETEHIIIFNYQITGSLIYKFYFRYESISANLEKSEREMRFDDHIDR